MANQLHTNTVVGRGGTRIGATLGTWAAIALLVCGGRPAECFGGVLRPLHDNPGASQLMPVRRPLGFQAPRPGHSAAALNNEQALCDRRDNRSLHPLQHERLRKSPGLNRDWEAMVRPAACRATHLAAAGHNAQRVTGRYRYAPTSSTSSAPPDAPSHTQPRDPARKEHGQA